MTSGPWTVLSHTSVRSTLSAFILLSLLAYLLLLYVALGLLFQTAGFRTCLSLKVLIRLHALKL